MMQTLTKTELSWIYNVMEKESMQYAEVMSKCEVGSFAYNFSELARDNLRSVMRKIHNAMNDGSKRIKID